VRLKRRQPIVFSDENFHNPAEQQRHSCVGSPVFSGRGNSHTVRWINKCQQALFPFEKKIIFLIELLNKETKAIYL
jgi:hypothetical protein